MERVLRRRQEKQLAWRSASPGAGQAQAAARVVGVQVIWGPLTERMQLEGLTVAEAERLLRHPFHIAPGVRALVNGLEATPNRELAVGDVLEFVRAAGEKGARV